MSPIFGSCSLRALCSPYLGVCVVMIVLCGILRCAVVGCRSNQWSMWLFVEMKVYVSSGVTCVRPMVSQKW